MNTVRREEAGGRDDTSEDDIYKGGDFSWKEEEIPHPKR